MANAFIIPTDGSAFGSVRAANRSKRRLPAEVLVGPRLAGARGQQMNALRTDLLASLRFAPDEIAFAGKVDELALALKMIAKRIHAAGARGEKPGNGTRARIRAVQRALGQTEIAYFVGRGM